MVYCYACACVWNEHLNSNNYWSCSVDCAPSDEGLYKVLQEHPNWEDYTIPLGLKAGQVDYFYRMKRGDNGLLALTHWRDGHCGDNYPGTWGFLLEVIGSIKGPDTGPNVAGDLKKEVIANRKWTLPVSVFEECTLSKVEWVYVPPPPLLTSCLSLLLY